MKNINIYHIIIAALIFIISILSGFLLGYVISQNNLYKEIQKYQNEIILLKEKIKELKNSSNTLTLKTNTEFLDYINTKKLFPKEVNNSNFHTPINIKTTKPKLVIIIDDVAFKYQVNLIKQIPYHITPSFFPLTKIHPYTPIYAKEFNSYMVHVPMEAFNFPHQEPNTLETNSSLFTIKKRISLIKKEFPNANFINNHTGSKFTSNYKAMNKLFLVLKQEGLGFVDSKTTPNSQSFNVNKRFHIKLFARNIFLDNELKKDYILNQLKKAIKIAKKKGYAIAIGHPHKITLETLKNAKNLLNQVDVIYIDELAEYAKN